MSLPSSWKEVAESKAHILGLKRYAFRREYSASRLRAAGFTNIEEVDAFDGFMEDVDKALKEAGLLFNPELKPGHKGFSYTQMMAYKRIIDDNVPYRILFEDDALGHLDLPKGLGQKFWDATPKDFDVLYLGSMMGRNPELDDPEKLVVKLPTYTTHALLVTLSGAKKIWALAKEALEDNIPMQVLDIQLYIWQITGKLNCYCWNGTCTQKSFPTFDEGLPWQAFPDVILPEKDTGLFWQNMRLGTTLGHPTLQLTIPQYSI